MKIWTIHAMTNKQTKKREMKTRKRKKEKKERNEVAGSVKKMKGKEKS